MKIKVKTRGRANAALVTAIADWASGVSGKEGKVTITGTKVLWRPTPKK